MLPSVSQNTTMSQLLAVVTTTATTATTMSNGPIVNDHLNSSSALNDNVTLEQQLSATNSTNPLTMTDTIMPKMDNMMDVFKISCSTAMIIGGLLPFLPQYIKIKKSRSSDGFSTYVCLTLLLANILRIAFWFGHRFELPLLIQSFVMIAGMMAMMDICIRVRNMESGYVVSSIGVRPNTMRTRRSLIGKILHFFSIHLVHDNDHGNGLDNETTHIYSVTTPRSPSPGDYNSDIAQCTAAPPAESVGATQISSELKPYHEQDPNREEDPSSVSNRNKMAHATTSRYQLDGDEDIISSFPDNESPILNKILAGNSTSQEAMPNDSYIANVPQDIISPCNGNGQLANNEEAALVKCEQTNLELYWIVSDSCLCVNEANEMVKLD
uniref:PQ-loop repeat-containing protein 1 n=1 Tax=Aceria tosichella TaxID=561515 RepID=A0A6G1SNN9_9ACAR